MEHPERFELEPGARWLVLASPWFMAVLAISCASLALFTDKGPPSQEVLRLGISIVGFLGFSLAAWCAWRVVGRLPTAAMSLDGDGLWPTISGKNAGLVEWRRVARLRERPISQRLEVLDESGMVVARLEYQLKEFGRLRRLVLHRATLLRPKTSASEVFQKSRWYHIAYVGSMIGWATLGLYVGQERPLLGYLGMTAVVAMIAWEYWSTPCKLRISTQTLRIETPGRCRTLSKEQVARIEVEDYLVDHAKHPTVALYVVNERKPVRMRGLGVQAIDLYQVLSVWKQPAN